MDKQTILRVYDNAGAAEGARAALLGAGVPDHAVHLRVQADEAGPVEGNFTVGNLPTQSIDHTYERNYADPAARGQFLGQFLLMVDASDPAMARQIEAVLARFATIDGH